MSSSCRSSLARALCWIHSISRDYDGVAGVLELISFTETSALTQGGTGLCTGTSCAFFYLPAKSFSQDATLAKLRFRIDPNAPSGPVTFDQRVVVGVAPLPLPPEQASRYLPFLSLRAGWPSC